MLPNKSRQAHISPKIKHSIVSIGALCDSGCTVTFKIKYISVVYKDDIILRGWRNNHSKLWYLPLSVKNEDEKVGDNENNLVNNVNEEKTNQSQKCFYTKHVSSLSNKLLPRL